MGGGAAPLRHSLPCLPLLLRYHSLLRLLHPRLRSLLRFPRLLCSNLVLCLPLLQLQLLNLRCLLLRCVHSSVKEAALQQQLPAPLMHQPFQVFVHTLLHRSFHRPSLLETRQRRQLRLQQQQ